MAGRGPTLTEAERLAGRREYDRQYRAKNRGRMCALQRVTRAAKPEQEMLRRARERARKYALPFSITTADIVIGKVCPALGIPLFPRVGSAGPNSPSLDRVVPELGYVPGNVVVISHRANAIKQNATHRELRAVADWFEQTMAFHSVPEPIHNRNDEGDDQC